MKLTDFKVLTFDCYGTLIDWETGLTRALAPLVRKAGEPAHGDVLAAFARIEADVEHANGSMPYSQLLSVVYKRLAKEWGVDVRNEEANIFGASIPDWPEFPDSPAALTYLKQHYRLIILSNVDRISFRSSNDRLGVEFDAIYSAQDIESYKPSLRNFEYMLARVSEDFGLGREDILHTAQSLFHDHVPANQMGLASAWIDRRNKGGGWGATKAPEGTPRYDFRFTSMAEMVAAHQREVAERGAVG